MNWLSKMFPWPAKHERKAAVKAARDEHQASREQAARSRIVKQQIDRLSGANHYADIIAGDIIHGHKGGRGGA